MLRRCQSAAEVLDVYEKESHSFDLVNYSNALATMHRQLVAAAPHKREMVPADRLAAMVAGVRDEVAALVELPKPREIASLVWGMSRMDVKDPETYGKLAAAATSQIASFNPVDTSQLLHGLARAGIRSEPTLQVVGDRVMAAPHRYTTKELTGIMAAFATLMVRHDAMFEAVETDLAARQRATEAALAAAAPVDPLAAASPRRRQDRQVVSLTRTIVPASQREQSNSDTVTGGASVRASAPALSYRGRLVPAAELRRALRKQGTRRYTGRRVYLEEATTQSLANAVFASVKLGRASTQLLEAFAPAIADEARRMNTVDIVQCAWAYTRAGRIDLNVLGPLFRSFAHPARARKATPGELATMARAATEAVSQLHRVADKAGSGQEQAEVLDQALRRLSVDSLLDQVAKRLPNSFAETSRRLQLFREQQRARREAAAVGAEAAAGAIGLVSERAAAAAAGGEGEDSDSDDWELGEEWDESGDWEVVAADGEGMDVPAALHGPDDSVAAPGEDDLPWTPQPLPGSAHAQLSLPAGLPLPLREARDLVEGVAPGTPVRGLLTTQRELEDEKSARLGLALPSSVDDAVDLSEAIAALQPATRTRGPSKQVLEAASVELCRAAAMQVRAATAPELVRLVRSIPQWARARDAAALYAEVVRPSVSRRLARHTNAGDLADITCALASTMPPLAGRTASDVVAVAARRSAAGGTPYFAHEQHWLHPSMAELRTDMAATVRLWARQLATRRTEASPQQLQAVMAALWTAGVVPPARLLRLHAATIEQGHMRRPDRVAWARAQAEGAVAALSSDALRTQVWMNGADASDSLRPRELADSIIRAVEHVKPAAGGHVARGEAAAAAAVCLAAARGAAMLPWEDATRILEYPDLIQLRASLPLTLDEECAADLTGEWPEFSHATTRAAKRAGQRALLRAHQERPALLEGLRLETVVAVAQGGEALRELERTAPRPADEAGAEARDRVLSAAGAAQELCRRIAPKLARCVDGGQ